MAGVGDLVAANGLGEGDNEADKVFAGVGVVEVTDVIRGLDYFGWGLELVGMGDEWDLLGVGDRGENYGLLGVGVGGQIQGWGADGSVDWGRADFGPLGRGREVGGTATFAASSSAGAGAGAGGRGWGLGGF